MTATITKPVEKIKPVVNGASQIFNDLTYKPPTTRQQIFSALKIGAPAMMAGMFMGIMRSRKSSK